MRLPSSFLGPQGLLEGLQGSIGNATCFKAETLQMAYIFDISKKCRSAKHFQSVLIEKYSGFYKFFSVKSVFRDENIFYNRQKFYNCTNLQGHNFSISDPTLKMKLQEKRIGMYFTLIEFFRIKVKIHIKFLIWKTSCQNSLLSLSLYQYTNFCF